MPTGASRPGGLSYGQRGLSVARGPVPRAFSVTVRVFHKSVRRALLISISSAHSNDRGGQAPALRQKRHFTVGRGPVPRHRSCARLCSSGSPDPDPFVIRRSQTTEVGPMPTGASRPGGLSYGQRGLSVARGTGPRDPDLRVVHETACLHASRTNAIDSTNPSSPERLASSMLSQPSYPAARMREKTCGIGAAPVPTRTGSNAPTSRRSKT